MTIPDPLTTRSSGNSASVVIDCSCDISTTLKLSTAPEPGDKGRRGHTQARELRVRDAAVLFSNIMSNMVGMTS